ncbi:hypothetical protein [Microbulbifer sp. YPW1]|uniref:hypothetical protein n=1 Tax=Microbulbifer sp. YPW1 TaxID=2745199 RepID=UPI001599FDFD|nr:hypothetical protein [Microbulbifer sp. YPW1]QKX18270.1 hypothetical protein HUW35_15590 [Microbulbifer sp. YPW1]
MQDFVLQAGDLGILIQTIRAEGYRLLGPVVRKNSVICGEIESSSELYAGTDLQRHSGRYTYFSHAAGLQAWNKSLQFPWRKVAHTDAGEGRLPITKIIEDSQPLAILGIRSCELHAISETDCGLGKVRHRDGRSAPWNRDFFSVSVNCRPAGDACICSAMGPESEAEMSPPGDLVMTEVCDAHDHYFLIGSDSYRGAQILQQLPVTPASEYQLELARKVGQAAVLSAEPDMSRVRQLVSRT